MSDLVILKQYDAHKSIDLEYSGSVLALRFAMRAPAAAVPWQVRHRAGSVSISNCAAGAVCDGYSRDTNSIQRLNFPTFSYGPYGQDSGPRYKVVDFRIGIEIGADDERPSRVPTNPGHQMGDVGGGAAEKDVGIASTGTPGTTKSAAQP